MRKFVVLGDAHLWPVLWQEFPAAQNDAFIAAEQVFDYAATNGLEVVASGDIFNFGQKGGVASCLTFLQRQLSRVKKFWYIVGNHDMTGYTSGVENEQWLEVFSVLEAGGNVHRLGTAPSLVCGDLRVCGIDYCHGRSEFIEKLNVLRGQKLDVLVIHQGLREILGYDGAWEAECRDFDDVARCVICGHTHVSWDVVQANTRVTSPGSTVPWRLDEQVDKSFPVIDFTDIAPAAVPLMEWMKIPLHREFTEISVTTEEEREKLLKNMRSFTPDHKLPAALQHPILRVRYQADKDFHHGLLEAAGGKFILDLRAERLSQAGKMEGGKEELPQDVDDILVATHKHTSPGRVRDAAIEIQRAKDPEGVIAKNIREIMGETNDMLV